MIKAIIFDYFGVLSSNEYWSQIKHDARVGDDFNDLAKQVNLGTLHWRDFVKELASRIDENPEVMEGMYEAADLDPRAMVLISHLKQSFKTVLLTNAHHEFLDPIIERAHLNEVFDCIFVSSKFGYPKPDPRIFQKCIDELKILPEEGLFIDDGEENIISADSIGLKTILYKDYYQMRDELEDNLKHPMPR